MRKFAALVLTALLWVATAASGPAYAAGSYFQNYYTWSGFGVLCAYVNSAHLQPGIYGDTWTAYSQDYENGGADCSYFYSSPYYDHFTSLRIDVYYYGWLYCGYREQTRDGTTVANAVLGGANFAVGSYCHPGNTSGPDSYEKYVSLYDDVHWAGAYHGYSAAYYGTL